MRKHAKRVIALGGLPVSAPVVRRERTHAKGSRTVVEWRVTWQRDSWAQKSKTFFSEAKARDKVGVLTSDEPWKFFGSSTDRERTGDDMVYCYELSREMSLRDECARRRGKYPPIVSVRIDRREVTRTPWEMVDSAVPARPADFSAAVSAAANILDAVVTWSYWSHDSDTATDAAG